jgi:uncharacterized HAD superfamily protein
MKKTIAIDIDDVLADNASGFVAYSNQRWGTSLNPEDYDEHWSKLWQCSLEETEKRANEFHVAGVVGGYEHFPDAKPTPEMLSKKYKLVITTSRRKQLITETTGWIDRYFGGIFEEIHYAGLWDKVTKDAHLATKAALCQQIGAEYLIDDQLKHCLAAAEVGVETILFGDYTWNQADILPVKVTRAHNWQEVMEYFDAQG